MCSNNYNLNLTSDDLVIGVIGDMTKYEWHLTAMQDINAGGQAHMENQKQHWIIRWLITLKELIM